MKRELGLLMMVAIVLLHGYPAEGQRAKKVPLIGFLAGTSPSTISDRIDAFRQGPRELGYVEGKNIIIESRGSGLALRQAGREGSGFSDRES